ncbi:uncharacterized protein J3R85_003049 [Psidium guajava]|nr:uncharacterized protein J3R85_003049 [Psidium guajava]
MRPSSSASFFSMKSHSSSSPPLPLSSTSLTPLHLLDSPPFGSHSDPPLLDPRQAPVPSLSIAHRPQVRVWHWPCWDRGLGCAHRLHPHMVHNLRFSVHANVAALNASTRGVVVCVTPPLRCGEAEDVKALGEITMRSWTRMCRTRIAYTSHCQRR